MRSILRLSSASAVLATLACAARGADDPQAFPPAIASAQATTTSPGINSSNAPGERTFHQVPLAIPAPPAVGLFPSTGQTLLNDGIDIHGLGFYHFVANPSAGAETGNRSSFGFFIPQIDFDLQRLIGLQGGSLHVAESLFPLKSNNPNMIFQTGGVLTGYQTVPIGTTHTLSLLTYEQKLLGDRLEIEFGRTSPYEYFFLPNGLDVLTQTSTVLYADGDLAQLPWPVWGARATYHLTPLWYLQGGAFEDNFRRAVTNGTDFNVAGATGAQVIAEAAYRSEFAEEAYPANLEAGVEYNSSAGGGNIKGTIAPFNANETAANYRGGGVIFFQGKKVIWRGVAPHDAPPANLAVYGSVNAAVDKPQPFDFDAFLGVNYVGFLPRHPFDGLGFQVHYQRMSQIEASFESRIETSFSGRPITQPRDGYAFELIGNIGLTRWAVFEPFVEYITAPDSYEFAFHPDKPKDGFIGGAYLTVSIGNLLGTSRRPF